MPDQRKAFRNLRLRVARERPAGILDNLSSMFPRQFQGTQRASVGGEVSGEKKNKIIVEIIVDIV